MRILVVGAGATGGYFGARLLQHGADVTFLVRPHRAELLARNGLSIRSSTGDITLTAPPTVTASELKQHFDLVLLSCKAYDLSSVIEDIAPAVGPDTAILPVLNGMKHLDALDARFGKDRVLGGLCFIASTLDSKGVVHHLNQTHGLTFGERDGSDSARIRAIDDAMRGANFEPRASTTIMQDMWDKWIFLASLAGITCLMRATVGDITAATGGAETTKALLEDCRTVAASEGYAPSEKVLQRALGILTDTGSSLTASMMRDLENGNPIEADHIVGDMLDRAGERRDSLHVLPMVYAHLKAYEIRRQHKAAQKADASTITQA